jgi:hypothetical protein
MADHKLLVSHIIKWEGKCGADPRDNALQYGHSGILGKGYDRKYPNDYIHTCKGITWGTYVNYCRIKKIIPNPKAFVEMSETLWGNIYKELFWDRMYADQIKSQAIAEILVEAIWGGGSKGMVRTLQRFLNSKGANLVTDGDMGKNTYTALNKYVNSKAREKEVFDMLTDQRMAYLRSLSDWVHYGNGWTNRVNGLKARAIELLKSTPVQIGGLLVFGTIAYLVYKNYTGSSIKTIL